jgi:hypothetical protein
VEVRGLSIMVLVAGCGRVGFGGHELPVDAALDAKPCTPIGHDEDGDGIDDACDTCPQRAGAQLDSDGDTIGDICDLSPAQESRTLFDPFTGPRSEWMYNGAETIANDVMHVPGLGDSIGEHMVEPPGRNTWELGGVLLAGGAGSRQLSLQIGTTTGQAHYYCELYDGGSGITLQFEYSYDGSTFMNVAAAPVPGRLDASPVRMTLVHTPPTMRCLATWKGVDYVAEGAIPAGIQPEQLNVAFNNVDVDVEYFVRLANP